MSRASVQRLCKKCSWCKNEQKSGGPLFSIRKEVARPERFELPTLWFEARCSIQLSYGRVEGILPLMLSIAVRGYSRGKLATRLYIGLRG